MRKGVFCDEKPLEADSYTRNVEYNSICHNSARGNIYYIIITIEFYGESQCLYH